MFFSFDRRVLYIILGACILFSLAGFFSDPSQLLVLLLSIPGVLIAITFHEYAHAFMAYKLGDDTAKAQGRLTLNPFKHTDPIGILMILFLGFGWGKPVQIDSRNLSRKMSASKAEAIVAFAGPAMNFLLAILFSVVYALLIKFGAFNALNYRATDTIETIISIIIRINVGLGIFNLIPLPPLDGSKILRHFLPYNAKEWFDRNEQIFYIVFLVIWISGIAGWIIQPAMKEITKGLVHIIEFIVGI